MQEVSVELEEDDLIDDYESDSERVRNLDIEERIEKPTMIPQPKIIYASRTHSQLSQFVKEIKKTAYRDLKCVVLGSRKNLCIHSQVNTITSLPRLNDKCLDLQDTKQGCPFKPSDSERQMLHYADQASIQDIEELVELGQKSKTCPYYGTRASVADADIICIPYNLLLQESARTASGIDIENNVIILDEAHNVIDAINSMHSITINSIELKATLMQLEKYYERYKSRLSGKNSLYIKQLKLVCEQLLKFRGLEENKKDSMLLGVPEYVEQLEIEHVNLFKLLNFLKETKLSNKLQGFSEKAKTKLQVNSSDEKLYLSTHSSPLRQLEQLFGTLNNPDEDGRVIISKADGILHIKYLLLNPANAFRNVIEQARSVIFAGGTMEPMNDFCQQLFPHLSQERIHRFSCGHVIPKKQLTTVSLSAGPSGQELLFSYEHRNKPNLIKEVGNTINNLVNVIPNGVVVFFPSYQYLDTVFKVWKENGILERIAKRKPIFCESPTTNDSLLQKYSEAIKSSQNAILFSIVGGKLSEGINFSDELGRAVIMVGLPFPNLKSTELIEKMKYLDSNGSSGKEYYENICMKQVNQCIGRAIRHRNDYACIVLLDKRYRSQRIENKLPKWIKDCGIEHVDTFGKSLKQIKSFFTDM